MFYTAAPCSSHHNFGILDYKGNSNDYAKDYMMKETTTTMMIPVLIVW